MEIKIEEVLQIIGAKEVELHSLRRQNSNLAAELMARTKAAPADPLAEELQRRAAEDVSVSASEKVVS